MTRIIELHGILESESAVSSQLLPKIESSVITTVSVALAMVFHVCGLIPREQLSFMWVQEHLRLGHRACVFVPACVFKVDHDKGYVRLVVCWLYELSDACSD